MNENLCAARTAMEETQKNIEGKQQQQQICDFSKHGKTCYIFHGQGGGGISRNLVFSAGVAREREYRQATICKVGVRASLDIIC